jgi:hypothetical protein
MTNPFQRHGIGHLSPSSINKFITSPGLWARQYLGGVKEGGNVKMWRGSAVEAGYVAALRQLAPCCALDVAKDSFWLNVEENSVNAQDTAEVKGQECLIKPMLEQCLRWAPPSALNAAQIKIEHWFPDVPVPVIGYVDLAFEGIDIDLKTTTRCPSKPDPSHVRQVSLYRAARERAGGLLYVTDKKHAYFDVDDQMMGAALVQLNDAALKLTKLLAAFDKPQDIIDVLPIDWDHWMAPKAAAAPRTASASSDFSAVELET